MDMVRIFDTTLRDGEQSPGATLVLQEKLEIARQLELMGADIIEAGFPITPQGDFDAVRTIAGEITRSTVCGLSRCIPKDIERAGEAVKGAHHPRIHVFCATSKIHREHKLKRAQEEILKLSVDGVKLRTGPGRTAGPAPKLWTRLEVAVVMIRQCYRVFPGRP